jgi:uncharacterized protein (TIGR00725 family)
MQRRSEGERPLRIAVSGAGADTCDPHLEQLGEEVGALLAENGAIVICGGLGGVMEGVARGAASRGGISVGFLPGSDADAANPYITLPIASGLGEARNVLVARSGDALIAIGGEWGTLSEVSLAMKIGVPVVLLAPARTGDLGLPVAASPREAVETALRSARGR